MDDQTTSSDQVSNDEANREVDAKFADALRSIEHTLGKLKSCTDQERDRLVDEAQQLRMMYEKLSKGRVEIVVFGEISTGKSALVNAILGMSVAEVDVRGGWTKEVWGTEWKACSYRVPGFEDSEVVLVDTPGINEVGGHVRSEMAREATERADLILFVVDSDLNETEHQALLELLAYQKPVILVLNKLDLYDREQRSRLMDVLVNERCADLLPKRQIVGVMADPREREYIIEAADGSTRTEWRKPKPDIADLEHEILDILEHDGTALLALNAALFAADRDDRITATRIRLRDQRANQVIWAYAVLKAMVMAWTPWPVVDSLGGGAVDVTMVGLLSRVYGIPMTWNHARQLVTSIGKAAGWYAVGEAMFHLGMGAFKGATFGFGTFLTAVPQGAAGGYTSYIVGNAAKYYFQHGGSWAGDSAKSVVKGILAETDRDSVIDQLKEEIQKRIRFNRHA